MRPAGTPGDDRLGRHVLDTGRVDRFLCSGRHEHLHAVEAEADGTLIEGRPWKSFTLPASVALTQIRVPSGLLAASSRAATLMVSP